MENSISSISLLDSLLDRGYNSSVISTFNCYFPFYEDVVLRKLASAGCLTNVLFVDADFCIEAFSRPETRPRRAGIDYTLIPVKTSGVFHPKLFMRLGKSKGSLFVGSHNMTLSGFGQNNEITNEYIYDDSTKDKSNLEFHQTLDYLSGFVPERLPEIMKIYRSVTLGVPWLRKTNGEAQSGRTLITSSRFDEKSLWARVVPLIPSKVDMAFICGPFFDPKLNFLKQVIKDVQPKKLVVGIDPSSVVINTSEMKSLPEIRFVNVTKGIKLPRRRDDSNPYLHAKILWFKGSRDELVVSGSANPSVAAFLAPSMGRNAEAVVADNRRSSSAELGLDQLIKAPEINKVDLESIEKRFDLKDEKPSDIRNKILIAVPNDTGFQANEPIDERELMAVGIEGDLVGVCTVRNSPDSTMIDAEKEIRQKSYCLQFEGPDSKLVVLVHRPDTLISNGSADNQKSLQQAITLFNEDSSQTDALFDLVEKVILNGDEFVNVMALGNVKQTDKQDKTESSPTSLAVNALGRRSTQLHQRIATGDMLVLLDAFSGSFGPLGTETSAQLTVKPIETADADEEDAGEINTDKPTPAKIAKICRGRIKGLIKKMIRLLERSNNGGGARHLIVRLAAVLTFVKSFRDMELRPEWRLLELVNHDDERLLFEKAVLLTGWNDKNLIKQALSEGDKKWFGELSVVIGLLGWLAWDIQIDVREIQKEMRQETADEEDVIDAGLWALVGTWLSKDKEAQDLQRDNIIKMDWRTGDGDEWIKYHMKIADRFSDIDANPNKFFNKKDRSRQGDLFLLSKNESPRIRIILKAVPNSTGFKVVVFDPDVVAKDKAQKYRRSFSSSLFPSTPWID